MDNSTSYLNPAITCLRYLNILPVEIDVMEGIGLALFMLN